jgi:hypothetical protein
MQDKLHKVRRSPWQNLPDQLLLYKKQARKGLFCYLAFGLRYNKY